MDSTPSDGCCRVTNSPKVVIMDKLHMLQVSKQGGRGGAGLRKEEGWGRVKEGGGVGQSYVRVEGAGQG